MKCGVLVVALATLVVALRWAWFVHPDIAIQRHALDVLLSSHWTSTYVTVPQAQMGPLPILLVGLPREAYVAVTALLVGPFLWWAAPRTAGRAKSSLWAAAAVGLVVPWSQFAWKGHADDALVLTGAALVVWALERSSTRLAVTGLVLATLAKPTAVLLAPALSPGLLLALVAATAAVWLPFALADPGGFLHAGRGITQVAPESVWGYLGVPHSRPPAWNRPVLFLAGLTAGWAVRARGPALAILLAFTVRSLLEFQPAPAYAASVVALALVVDARTPWRFPAFTVLALGAFWTSQPALEGYSGLPRLGFHLAVLGLGVAHSLGPQRHRRAQQGTESTNPRPWTRV